MTFFLVFHKEHSKTWTELLKIQMTNKWTIRIQANKIDKIYSFVESTHTHTLTHTQLSCSIHTYVHIYLLLLLFRIFLAATDFIKHLISFHLRTFSSTSNRNRKMIVMILGENVIKYLKRIRHKYKRNESERFCASVRNLKSIFYFISSI